jgi:hypothetical protein
MEHECYTDEWIEWLQGRLAADSGDWDHNPDVTLRSCPVCGESVDYVPADIVRGYGARVPDTTQGVCVCCGYIYRVEPVAAHLRIFGHFTTRTRP